MPQNVQRFERLAYLSLAFGVVVAFMEDARLAAMTNWMVVLLTQAIVFGLTVLLIWLIARRRKGWVRWLFLAGFVLGLPQWTSALASALHANTVLGFLMALQVLAQVAALYFVFFGDARDWFRQPRVPSA